MIFRNETGSLQEINRSTFILNKEYYNAIRSFLLNQNTINKKDEEKYIKTLVNSKVVNS